eukprot:CAMPEP_0204296962 /NCGR_PEP_ID=MMETSP0468-20130131/72335_1 /ASSEMBLY_ACC=CAM_ASM_000383 /TAXON_ID=2969 /ORGANISM="Oxyrrhis marina" /LENGTH=65 /DNA_ID=CAMNT_0051275721 /DNA_START=154 /DNA_END=348 /DNA_ORIENTATION=-
MHQRLALILDLVAASRTGRRTLSLVVLNLLHLVPTTRIRFLAIVFPTVAPMRFGFVRRRLAAGLR